MTTPINPAEHYALTVGAAVIRTDTGAWITPNGAGWEDYQAWLAAGNTPDAAPVSDAKIARKADVAALYQAKIGAGMTYQGKPLQIDEDSQLRITGAAAAAGLVGTVPAVGWRMGDNTFLPLANAAAMVALATAAAGQVETLRARMWAHRDAIDALTDAASIRSYDINAGW